MTVVNTSRYGLVIDNLLAQLNASPVFASPVYVIDGPGVLPDDYTQAIFVGFDGFQDTNYAAGVIDHQWAYVGVSTANETLSIPGSIMCWTGDITVKPARDAALVLLAGLETILRNDPTLGIDGGTDAQLLAADMFLEPYAKGLQCRIAFTVNVVTQLLST